MKKQRQFLVPIDGSERALETCRYVASIRPFHALNAVLLHVFSGVPDACFDFFIGRVTNKVLHLAHDRSVWIVH